MCRTPAANTLFYGDNLHILREYVEDESVDLVYLDPPFNSNATYNKHQFQLWALSMIEAQPYKGGKKGADTGIDGFLYFRFDGRTTEKAIVEVKGGENVSPQWVRVLGQVVERERAKIGVLLMLGDPTVTMRREAAATGFYESPLHGKFPKIQILTVEELFDGKKPHMPWIDPSVFKKARREVSETQGDLGV